MTSNFSTAMRRAMELTRASNVAGATRAIQEALSFGRNEAEPAQAQPSAGTPLLENLGKGAASPATSGIERIHKPLSEVVRILKRGRAKVLDVPAARRPPVPTPEGAQFLSRVYSGDAGTRRYKIYVPKPRNQAPRGLVVMLHGCQQNADDFAVGTGMNAIAEAENVIVAYPQQEMSANAGSCWNWFMPSHQVRDRGEPASIAAITRALIAEFNIPPANVFAAGLSAGGAMAVVLAETYPDLYAAVGVHSGLAYASANDVMSAFSVMRGDKPARSPVARPDTSSKSARMIIFHGSADTTVHPSNAQALVDAKSHAGWRMTELPPANDNGHVVTRQVFEDDRGTTMLEVWRIQGAGHAWSGGQTSGSFTDPSGPDASAEMLHFFLRPK